MWFYRRRKNPNLRWKKPFPQTKRQKDRHYLGKNHFRFPPSFPKSRRRQCHLSKRTRVRAAYLAEVTSMFPRARSPRTMQHCRQNRTLSLAVSLLWWRFDLCSMWWVLRFDVLGGVCAGLKMLHAWVWKDIRRVY